MSKCIIYVLTNRFMPGIIKIGTANTIAEAKQELSDVHIPGIYNCEYATEVNNCNEIFGHISGIFKTNQVDGPNEHFFAMSPDDVIPTLKALRGTDVKIGLTTPDIQNSPVPRPIQGTGGIKRVVSITGRWNFSDFNIPAGAELVFTHDTSKKCHVAPDQIHVIYKGQPYSLSGLAKQLIHGAGYSWPTIQGPNYFTYNGKKLTDIRAEFLTGGGIVPQTTAPDNTPDVSVPSDDGCDILF